MPGAEYVREIYIDEILLVNFTMDILVLWVTSRMLHLSARMPRLVSGALCGAFYSLVVIFFEGTLFSTILVKALFSLVMLGISFGPLSIKVFLRVLVLFYAVSFLTGGAVIGAVFMTERSTALLEAYNGALLLFQRFDYRWLLVGAGAALLAAFSSSYIRKNNRERGLISPVTIGLAGEEIRLQAFWDTGNQLFDPLTKKPVVIVEAAALASCLPEELVRAVMQDEEAYGACLFERLGRDWAARIRLIPYNSLGKTQGIMIGVRSDYLEVSEEKRTYRAEESILGLAKRKLQQEGRYQVLLHPDVREQILKVN